MSSQKTKVLEALL